MFHPLMRVWIEIKMALQYGIITKFHPLMRVWIEMSQITAINLYW